MIIVMTYVMERRQVADFRDIAQAGAELAVTVGIIEAAVDQNAPEEVKENFQDKVDEAVEQLQTEILEFIQFGEAYDGG